MTWPFDRHISKEPTHISGGHRLCIDFIFTSQPNLSVDSDMHPSFHENCHDQIIYSEFNLKTLYPSPYEKLISITSMQISILLRKPLIVLTGKKLLKTVTQFSKLLFWLIPFFNIMSNFIPNGAILIDDRDPLWNFGHLLRIWN